MRYRIDYSIKAARQLTKIPRNTRDTILKAIHERLGTEPERFKALSGDLKGYYRLRVGSYRVIYRIEYDVVLVIVVRIGVRGNVYEKDL